MSETAAAEIPKASGGVSLLPLMLATVAAVVVAVACLGGALFWLARSGRLPLPAAGPSRVEAASAAPLKMHTVALEPLLVNLADADGRSYLRLAMTLQVEDAPVGRGEKQKEDAGKGKVANEFEAAERDTALAVMGRETSAALLAADGKQHLKDELREALHERVPEAKIVDVLFTEFLVQR